MTKRTDGVAVTAPDPITFQFFDFCVIREFLTDRKSISRVDISFTLCFWRDVIKFITGGLVADAWLCNVIAGPTG